MNSEIASLGIEEQVQQLESIADPASRAIALDLIASVLKLHATGIERMLHILRESSGDSQTVEAFFRRDPLVHALLLLHDLEQQPPEVRVQEALTALGPQLEKLGASVTVLSLDNDAASVKVHTHDSGSRSTPESIRSLVEQTILEAAPDIGELHVAMETPPPTIVPISAIQPAAQAAQPAIDQLK